MTILSSYDTSEDRTPDEQVYCSVEDYEGDFMALDSYSLDGSDLVMRGRRLDSDGGILELRVLPCPPPSKVWKFSDGIAAKLLHGDTKNYATCGECGAEGAERPWYEPYFLADCGTPLCLECCQALMACETA